MQSEFDLKKFFSDEEERLAFSRALDLAKKASRYYEAEFTDFLDMEKVSAFTEKLSYIDGINIDVFGGVEDTERRIIGFFPDFEEIDRSKFPIKPILIRLPKFGKSPGHRDYLGALVGLGIDRRKMGDIFVLEGCALAFVSSDIAEYISANLEYVGRTKVSCSVYDGGFEIMPEKRVISKFITAASLRLDAVLASAFNLSRSRASSYIVSESVRINWRLASSGTAIVKEKDLISIKGIGRVRIAEIKGSTKKNRVGITIEKDA